MTIPNSQSNPKQKSNAVDNIQPYLKLHYRAIVTEPAWYWPGSDAWTAVEDPAHTHTATGTYFLRKLFKTLFRVKKAFHLVIPANLDISPKKLDMHLLSYTQNPPQQ